MTNRTRYHVSTCTDVSSLEGKLNSIAECIEKRGGRVACTRVIRDDLGYFTVIVTSSTNPNIPQKQRPETLGGSPVELAGDVGVEKEESIVSADGRVLRDTLQTLLTCMAVDGGPESCCGCFNGYWCEWDGGFYSFECNECGRQPFTAHPQGHLTGIITSKLCPLPQEDVAKHSSGPGVHLLRGVGVDITRETDGGVTQPLLDDGEAETGFEAGGGVPVSEVVDAHPWKAGLPDRAVPAPGGTGEGEREYVFNASVWDNWIYSRPSEGSSDEEWWDWYQFRPIVPARIGS